MINESNVKIFLAIVRAGSLTEAGRHLYLSQQAVSKQLAKLEQDLDCTLLQRSRGKMELTPEGEIYFEAFSKIDSLLEYAHSAVEKMHQQERNLISVGVPELLDIGDIGRKIFYKFHQKFSEVEIKFRTASNPQITQWLESGELDAAITFQREAEQCHNLAWLPMETFREMLIVSAHHPKALPGAICRDFVNERIFFTERTPEATEQFQSRLENIGFPTDRITPTDNMLSSCAAVEQMQGISFLLENCTVLNNDALCAFPDGFELPMVFTYRTNSRKLALNRLVECAREVLADNK